MPNFHCNVCSQDISRLVRIKCAECTNFDLCIPCFSSGQTSGAHKITHSYRVIETNSVPIFHPDWGADEELLLIEGLELFGLGNWADVADYIGTARSKEDCELHYLQIYLASPDYPIPRRNVQVEYDIGQFRDSKRRRIEGKSLQQKYQKSAVLTSVPANHEIQGYMPGRLEFEIEIENEAEAIVKDISFDEDLEENNEGDIDLKLAVLDVYNSRLTKRNEIKRFFMQHNLLDYRKLQVQEKKRSKEERDLFHQIKCFAKLQSFSDFTVFSEGLLNELYLRQRIQELQDWRRNGLTTLAQGAKYEKEKAQRLLYRSHPSYSPSNEKIAIGKGGKSANLVFRQSLAQGSGSGVLLGSDAHLLTLAEQSLCSTLQILPKPYLAIKISIIRYLLDNDDSMQKFNLKDKFNIDFNILGRINDFFTSCGWIPSAKPRF